MNTTFLHHDDIPNPRRRFLQGGSAAAVTAAFGGPIAALAGRVAQAADVTAPVSFGADSPYGPLAPTRDQTTGLPIIQLPPGFSYKTYGWRGDLMSDGLATPGSHDGMGVVRSRRVGRSTELVLVRNHERGNGSSAASIIGAGRSGIPAYDTGHTASGIRGYQGGGNTNLVWRDGNFVESFASLGGTCRNCAGGATLWDSWLSNEEVLTNAVSDTGKRHGYIFEVPADISQISARAEPIVGMGRMAHEASAIDPDTGDWYLTEDQGNANTLYRFRPARAGGGLHSLHAGGTLQGLKVRKVVNADLRFPRLGQAFEIEWVDIADPDLDSALLASRVGQVSASGPYLQAYAKGAAIFGANEGCWVASGRVYFTDKQVGFLPRRAGRIWALDLATSVLQAIFVSDDITVGNSPDNVCVSPRGGVVFCEDGDRWGFDAGGDRVSVPAQRLMALTRDGGSYAFAANHYDFTAVQLAAAGKPGASTGNLRNTEWCGACFSPDGSVLFANLQSPGLTLAITGPWAKGNL